MDFSSSITHLLVKGNVFLPRANKSYRHLLKGKSLQNASKPTPIISRAHLKPKTRVYFQFQKTIYKTAFQFLFV
jgi:hypothetical protein